MMYLGMDFFEFILFRACWACWIYKFVFCQNRGPFGRYFFNYFFLHHTLSFPFGTRMAQMLDFLILSQRTPRLCSFFKSLFSLLFGTGNFSLCHFYLHIHWLFLLPDPLCFWTNSVIFFRFLGIVFFSHKIPIWFFFITPFLYFCTSWSMVIIAVFKVTAWYETSA